MKKMILITVLASAFYCNAAGEPEKKVFPFSLKIDAKVTTEKSDKSVSKIVNKTELDYRYTQTGRKVDISIDRISHKTIKDGKEDINLERTKDYIKGAEKGKSHKLTKKTHPEITFILDSMSTPLLRLVLDKNGKEFDRKILVEEGPKRSMIEDGTIESTRIFHPVYYGDKKKAWKAPMKISIGEGRFVYGDLDYELVKDDSKKDSSRKKVKVSGTLSGYKNTELELIYKVSGQQYYDTKLRHWVKGVLDISVTMVKSEKGTKRNIGSGTMKMEMERKK